MMVRKSVGSSYYKIKVDEDSPKPIIQQRKSFKLSESLRIRPAMAWKPYKEIENEQIELEYE